MYLRILKKDLKRKKTMNLILLIFISLSAMFVSSSVNNIITVTNALDSYFDKAGVPDYFVATMEKAGDVTLAEKLEGEQKVESYGTERVIFTNPENFYYDGHKIDNLKDTSVLMSFDDAQMNYFDKNNNIIEKVEPGTVLVSGKLLDKTDLSVGDTIELRLEGVSINLKIAGTVKDAILGSDMMGMTRFMINDADFKRFADSKDIFSRLGGGLWYIQTDDTEAVKNALIDESYIIFDADRPLIKMTYVMDMIIAGILLVVSVCLILVAFVVLRFTIAFTLTEEYREIGVMKAIGIKNSNIRGLYMSKYLTLAVLGAVIGFFAGIPFGNMLLESVSESMVLENENGIIINVLCSVGIVGIILLVCYGCTAKVKKFTPIDAIRSGATGERFKKKSVIRLGRFPTKPAFFMAVNDVLSSPKRFITVTLIYTLCLLLVLIQANTVNTLRSDDLINSFGVSQSDAYYVGDDADFMSYLTSGGKERVETKLTEMENTLLENGLSAKCTSEVQFKLKLVCGDNSYKSIIFQGVGTSTDMYRYFEGTPPQSKDEIAITPLIAEKLRANIGDKVTIQHSFGDREYIITAFFQSMNNMGEGVRLHEDADTDYSQAMGFYAFQITFSDNPDKALVNERIDKLKEIFDTENVWTAGGYVERMVGVSGMLDSTKMLIIIVVLTVILLVTVLTERSFISRERGEIAITKAIGFKSGSVILHHSVRFGIVSVFSTIIALLLEQPLTDISVGPIFSMMGANYGVQYEIVPLEIYLIYPLIVLAITVISAFFTALYTIKIKASEASCIE